jgi:hypothetical protein
MSPLPERLTDRWREGRGSADPGHGALWWVVLLGSDPQLRMAAQAAQSRISEFTGLHMTPRRWLHLTVLTAGPEDQISPQDRSEMLAIAKSHLAETGPITVELSRILIIPKLLCSPSIPLRH